VIVAEPSSTILTSTDLSPIREEVLGSQFLNQDYPINFPPLPHEGASAQLSYLTKTPLSLSESTLKDPRRLKEGHIILFSRDHHIYYFVSRLRRAIVTPSFLKDIVLLSPDPPRESVWRQYSCFADVWFFQGHPYDKQTLKSIGLEKASFFILLKGRHHAEDPCVSDSENVLLAKFIKGRLNFKKYFNKQRATPFPSDSCSRPVGDPPLRLVTELDCRGSYKYLCSDFYTYEKYSIGSYKCF
jgi:hypothetical protein